MSTITIPANLTSAFVGGKPSRICDENGNITWLLHAPSGGDGGRL